MSNKIICNTNRVTEALTYKQFVENNTLLVESSTGSGKSYAFSHYASRYLKENSNKRIISIFGKRNLGKQHKKYLQDKMDIHYYTDPEFKNNLNGNLLICVNSLFKYTKQITDNMHNYVVFLDEISILTTEITHNETIVELKQVYSLLKKLILNCDKVFACQNEINDAGMELLKQRLQKKSNKTIHIKNEYKNNQDKKALKCSDINILIEKMERDIKKGKYFLFCSDSKTEVEKLYTYFTKEVKDNTKYCLFTSDSKEKFDENKDYENMYLFYSPCIGAGVDFSFDKAQNQYVYIKGSSQVDSMTIYQMSMRCRNLRNLVYAINPKLIPKKQQYKDYEDCYDTLLKVTRASNKAMLSMCYNLNMDDEVVFTPNSFFPLYVHNEYLSDIYGCNIVKEFEKLLLKNGFNIINEETKNNDYTADLIFAKDQLTAYNNKEFDDYCREETKNESLDKVCDILRLDTAEDKLKYREILQDPYKTKGHFNLVKVFSNITYLKSKFEDLTTKLYDIKMVQNSYTKIILIKKLMEKFNVDLLNMNKDRLTKIQLSEEDDKALKFVLRCRTTIATKYDFVKFIIGQINTLCNCDVITAKCRESIQIDGKRVRFNNYVLDKNILDNHFELYQKRNTCANIEPSILDFMGIEIENDDLENLNDIFGNH